jgi:hypothetical protein
MFMHDITLLNAIILSQNILLALLNLGVVHFQIKIAVEEIFQVEILLQILLIAL